MIVAAVKPVFGHTAHFSERGEHVAVQHFGADGAVEAFDVSIRGRLAGLDMHQLDAMLLRPLLERGADELGAVVQPQAPWSTSQLDRLSSSSISALVLAGSRTEPRFDRPDEQVRFRNHRQLQNRTMSKKADPEVSKPLYPADTNFPKTHCFYEYEGERAVDPAVLVENGILLWHEQIHANERDDVSPLWAYAEALLEKRGQTPTHSYLEWLRQEVIVNARAPDSWNKLEPYPYKGLLISALYLQEARRLCHNGDTGRVWHIIALAYYNLGLNTVHSASHVFATYAAKQKAEDSEYKRAIILQVLKRLEGDASITSVADAKRAVIKFIESYKSKDGKHVLLSELEKLDRLTPKNSKHSDGNDALGRLEHTLNSWAGPKGPYPEMAEAFAVFNRKKAQPASVDTPEPRPARTTSEAFEFETTDYHTRIFNLLADGKVLSLRLAHDQDQ